MPLAAQGIHRQGMLARLASSTRPLAAAMAVLLAGATITIMSAPPAQAAAPTVSVSLSGGSILAGSTGTLNVSASNTGIVDGFNLAIVIDVPVGIEFVSSSLGTPTIYNAANQPTIPIDPAMQRWVWEDISDLPAGGSQGGTVTVRPVQPAQGGGIDDDPAVSPVGASVQLDAYAALSGDPTYLPVFNGSTGVGGPAAIAETGTGGPATRTIDIVSLRVAKSEPSAEAELMRGVHTNATTYTLTVTATTEGVTDNSVLIDFLPAGLEFLGCGTADNSTVDRDPADATVNEYDGAPRLDAVGDVASNCIVPTTVSTITADAALASDYGLTNGAVYTRIEWQLGTLAAGSVTTIRYAAAVPLRANTVVWDGAAPTPESGLQAANLDNNNGASTRHGSATPIDGTSWTNVAAVVGDYQGVVRTGTNRGVGSTASESVHAMDVAVLKSVDGADSHFSVGNIADFTLDVHTGEYMSATDIVLTDEIPNGLCPLLPVGVTLTLDPGASVPAECQVNGTVTGAVVDSATAHADGTFTVVFRPTDGGDPASFELAADDQQLITYQALNRSEYVTSAEYGSTTSGDRFGNHVEVQAVTHAIAPIAAAYPELLAVWDDSNASIASDLTTIDKRVKPRDEVLKDLAPGVDPCTSGTWTSALAAGFKMGDTVCFELRVNFPASVDTRNAVVTDYLPAGLTYVGHQVDAASTAPVNGSTATVGGTSEVLEWELGVVGAGGDLYVPRGSVFIAHVWARVDQASNGLVLDKPQNLLKYRQQNVSGELYFLRDEATVEVDAELELVKGVEDVTDNNAATSSIRTAATEADPDGTVYRSNRDGIQVAEGEVVGYRIDIFGAAFDATAAEVWDLLPAGIAATDVSSISDGGVAYNPGDGGYPAGLAPENSARSVIVWTNVAVPAGNKTLRYDVTIPTPTGVQKVLENTASLISYGAGVNTSTDPAGQLYVPAGSLDTSRAGSANTDGAGTVDTSEVYLPQASVAKAITSGTAASNTASQVAKGEIATSTFSVTVPAHTSVLNGVLSDVIANASNWAVDASATQVTYPGGSTAAGAGSFTIGSDTFTVNTSTGSVTFPAVYTNTTDSPQVFEVHLEAYITSASAWSHATGTARSDTAQFTSTGASTLTATASVYLIEPSPTVTKFADDDVVYAGQTVTYTITASNAAGRPTLFDTVVTDCVPAALSSPSLGAASQGSASSGPDGGCTGELITWNVGDLGPGASATLSYSVGISPAAAGGATYVNDVDLLGYSQPSGAIDRETYTRTTSETVTVQGSTISKTVDATTATIGRERTFTITTVLPANVNFYDAAVIDSVPATMSIGSATVSCVDASLADCTADLTGGGTALTTSGTLHGWWLGDIAADPQARTITVTYTGTLLDLVGTDRGDTIVNTARMRWNTANTLGAAPADASYTGNATTTTATATVTVVEPVVGVSKTVNGAASATVSPGSTFTYVVTATNTGTFAASDVTVTDDVPTGVVVDEPSISAGGVLTGDGPNGGGTITWTAASIAASGGSVSFTYDATLAASSTLSGAALTNTATVTEYFSHPTGAGFDTGERRTYAGPTDTAAVTPGFPDPQVVKTAASTVAYIGTEQTFTITITNPGAGTATGLEAVDVLPDGFAYVAGSSVITPGADLDPSIAGQTLTWDSLSNLAVGGTLTIQYRAVPRADYTWTAANTGADTQHVNQVTVNALDSSGSSFHFDGQYFTDTDDAYVTINDADLDLTKSHSGAIVAGQNFTWTIQVHNAGPDAAVGPIVVTDQLPAGATLVGITGTGWVAGTPNGSNEVTFTRASTLASAATTTITVTASFPAATAAGTDAENGACVAARTFDSDTSDNCATDPGTVTVLADLELAKVLTGSTYTAGEPITWNITATNNGPSNSDAPFTVTDQLPAGVDWATATASGTGWTCGTADLDTGEIVCSRAAGTLAPAGSLPTIVVTADVLASWTGTIANTATITGTTPEPGVPGTSNNTDTVTTGAVGTEADLAIVKTFVASELVTGGQGRYRLTITNNGPSDALNVVIADQLPAGLTYAGGLTTSGQTWACTPSGSVAGLVDCTLTSGLGTVADGATMWLEFDVDVASSVTATVRNTATVSSDTSDPVPGNNTDDVDVAPTVGTNLALTKTHDTGIVYRVGDEVAFTLTVTNNGLADAADVRIVDTLPTGLTFDRVEGASGWTVTGPNASRELTLTLDDPLVAGGTPTTATITVIATIGSAGVPTVINAAEVDTSTPETTHADNTASDPVEVDSPDLTIIKDVDVTRAEGGDTVHFTMTVSNVDDDAHADNVTVTDAIPADLRVLDDPADIGGATWDCTLTGTDADGYGGTLSCELATLAPATTATDIGFDAIIDPLVSVDMLVNTGAVSSPDEHASKVNSSNSDDAAFLVAWIDLSANSVCVNDAPWLQYTIDARNVANDLPITATWYPDADANGVADGAAIATQVLPETTNGSTITGEVLWPGAQVDASNVGIAWPGYRVALVGETPDWENQVEDASLPEHALRSGALVVLSINPERSVTTSYPPSTVACQVTRDVVMDVTKTADKATVHRGEMLTYTLTVANDGYGATNQTSLSDPVPAELVVEAIAPQASSDPTVPDWSGCTLTGAEPDGSGGTIDCTLNGWLGYGQSAPPVLVTAKFVPGAGLGGLTNVAIVSWFDPEDPTPFAMTADDDAGVFVVYSADELLAMTGPNSPAAAVWGLLLIGAGLGLLRWRDRIGGYLS